MQHKPNNIQALQEYPTYFDICKRNLIEFVMPNILPNNIFFHCINLITVSVYENAEINET